ncbi:MAG TPA: adenylate/guanylate cyclase domain-containing protein, partial [Actinomycetota bacterium]
MELPTGTVTFFFTDIEGSTNHARAFGPRWPEVLEQHHGILRNAIRGAGGIDVRTEGDAFFAVFRSPADAVRAAAAAQRELTQHQWPEDRTVRVRMGMHTGEGRLAGDDYIGLDVHRAARIAASAHGGQVLLSEATRALVANVSLDGLRLRGLGKHRLKDFDEPQLLYQIEVDGLPGDFPPPRTLETPLNLPVQLTSFIGRDHELAQITQLLRERRLLTLTGPGGTGKTRIAVESANRVGEDFPDGIYFVDLSALRDPRLVPSAILVALGRKPAPDRTVLDTVTSYLHDRSCLLVLDNYEQVVEAADVAHRILEEAPATKVIATSRVRLDVAGEQEFPIPPLDVPSESRSRRELLSSDSVRLFVERARAVRPAFELTEENAEAVALICARLDGLPLALELAAVQMRLLHPHELLGRLERRLAGLGTGSRDVPERQRSLRR